MTLKKSLYALVAVATLGLTACDDYDDGALWDAVNDHENRIEALEQWQEQVNGNIAALQQLLSTTDYITKVTPVTEDGRQVGYTIEFLNQSPITIYNGEKGDTGQAGADGDDGQTPEIGLMKDADGNWYWTLDGELMLDQDGNPIRANGHDGDDGSDGQPGQPGSDGQPGAAAPTPQIALGGTLTDVTCYGIDGKQEDSPAADAWYLSVDGGKTWYRISGEKGEQGDTGGQGQQGDKGEQGDAWFACEPKLSADGLYYIFTLSDDDNTNLSDNPTFNVAVYQAFSLGTGTLTFGPGTVEVPVTLPDGTTADDYQAMVAQITPEGADGTFTDISTRAGESVGGWSVEADLQGGKVTVTAQERGQSALLRVTLVRNDGSEITASRVLSTLDYEIVDGVYVVYLAEGLYAWNNAAQQDETTGCILAADITLPDAPEGGSNWTPIYRYSGTFDGAGHTVSNMTVNDGSNNDVGFFQILHDNATVKNLHFANATVNAKHQYAYAGVIAGTVGDTDITGCSVTNSTVNAGNNAGGIVGYARSNADITGCSVTNSTVTSGYDTGGIVGFSVAADSGDGNIHITACRVSGGTVTGGGNVGGIVGYNIYYSYITACYTTAGVSGGSNAGAFVGFNNSATITAGYWLTDTQADGVGLNTGGSDVTKVEGGVTWKTATEAMNAAIPTDGSCPYRFVQSDGENNPPVLESTGE